MEGKGSVGESLFAAGLGGADLKGLLGALESEAQELFKPGGSLPKLNAEARTYKDLKTKIRDLSLLPKDWEELEGEVSSLENRSSQIKEQIARMSAEVDHLKRLRDALPVFAELKEYRKKRADLGEVKVLRRGVLHRTSPDPVRERPGPFRREDRAAKDRGDRHRDWNPDSPGGSLGPGEDGTGPGGRIGQCPEGPKGPAPGSRAGARSKPGRQGDSRRAPPGPLLGIRRRAAPDGGSD